MGIVFYKRHCSRKVGVQTVRCPRFWMSTAKRRLYRRDVPLRSIIPFLSIVTVVTWTGTLLMMIGSVPARFVR